MNAAILADAVEIITLLGNERCRCYPETDSEGKTVDSPCLRCRGLAWLKEATK